MTYDLTGTPRTVTLDDVCNTYTYSADGVKQRVVSRFYGHMAPLGLDAEPIGRGALDGGGLIDPGNHDFSVIRDTRYCGPFVLEDDTLSMVLFPGGFCTVSGGQPSFHYYVRDHRGDNRCVVSEDGAYEQKTFYYPLGGIIGDKSTAPSLQPYKHSGKEWDHLGGLDWYDYGARMYDPALGVWTSGDPLAEDNPHMSIYAFCGNDPVNRIDPDGRKVHPADSIAYITLLNTINPEERQFVVLDNNGNIDYDIMSNHKSESENYSELLILVSSDLMFNINIMADFSYMNNEGIIKDNLHLHSSYEEDFKDIDFLNPNGLSTGETGFNATTLLPGKGTSGVNSPDNSVHIYIDPSLSTLGKAEVLSHELYGHAFLYHKYRNRNKSKHDVVESVELNWELKTHILRARRETVSYFK